MKTWTVVGRYRGRVRLKTSANTLAEALKRFMDADDEEVEILDPSYVEYEETDVKEQLG